MSSMEKTIKWEYSNETIKLINTLNAPLLAIAGASGSGKSYLTDYLLKCHDNLSVIKNYTTRPQRTSDAVDHFEYISDEDFNNLLMQDKFLLARYEEYPCYGYLKNDVLDSINNEKIPLFMFRHSGIKMISSLISNLYIIAINTNPLESTEYSKNEISMKSTVATTASQNDILNSTQHFPNRYVLTNDYSANFTNDEGLWDFIKGIKS